VLHPEQTPAPDRDDQADGRSRPVPRSLKKGAVVGPGPARAVRTHTALAVARSYRSAPTPRTVPSMVAACGSSWSAEGEMNRIRGYHRELGRSRECSQLMGKEPPGRLVVMAAPTTPAPAGDHCG
jgi:hypothetical protein